MLQRKNIAFFGRTNSGKSLLVNAVTAQNMSIVSDIKGTTTDPVKKVMELFPLGPVTIIDTAGLDDDSELGEERMAKSLEILNQTDIAVLVADSSLFLEGENPLGKYEEELKRKFQELKIPYITVFNKCDLLKKVPEKVSSENQLFVSALTKENVNELRERLGSIQNAFSEEKKPLVSDLVKKGDTVILVIPLDESAPKDRLILPQQMVLRELLEYGAIPVCCQPENILLSLEKLSSSPALVITDSQVFDYVNKKLPRKIPLTSFSILMARFKGKLEYLVKGVDFLSSLCDGDKILISEGCSHHRQCGDIGSIKLPAWINAFTRKNLSYEFTSGSDFPADLSRYKLVIHCGACMLKELQMKKRMEACMEGKIPLTNYGMAIAKVNGILERSLAPLNMSSAGN